MTGAVIVDSDGNRWPVTGHWCRACRMPLIVTDHPDMHPHCALKENQQ